jgi:hypothetical protein
MDEVYRPISDDDTESETPPASDLSIVDPAEFRRKSDDERDDYLTVKDAAVQRSRQPDPYSAESAFEREMTVHKVAGTGPISANEAVDAMRWSRAHKLGGDLRDAGMSEGQINEMAADLVTRGERMDPLAPPPAEAKVLEHFGEDKKTLTATEAANELSNWRERYQQSQQEALQELGVEAEQERQAEALAAQQAPSPTEQPQQQPSQPQPEMTPAQIELAKIAAERERVTNLKKLSGMEAALRNDYDQLVAAVVQEFPGLRNGPPNPADVEQLRVQDPQRFQKLAMADQMLRERQQKIAVLANQRAVHEREQAHLDSVARAAARAVLDKQFEQIAPQHIPNWERSHGEIRAQARKTLLAAGASENDLKRMWSGDESIDLHSIPAQVILAKAAQWDLAQEKARQVRQTPVPQVLKPGMYRRASDGDAQSVHELTARLKNATGREAIRLGTALTKAKRALNGG